MFWVIEIRLLTDAGVWRICDRAFRTEYAAKAQCDEWNEPIVTIDGDNRRGHECRVRHATLDAV